LNNTARYNYFNLILRIAIGIAAVLFIATKLLNDFPLQLNDYKSTNVNWYLLLVVLVLGIVNWGIETYKWRFLIYNVKQISFLHAFRLVLTGITISLITPNRVGEIPARAYLLNDKENLKQLVYYTFIGSYAQLLLTWIMGLIGLYFTLSLIDIDISLNSLMVLAVLMILLVVAFFYFEKIKLMVFKFFKIEPVLLKHSNQFLFALLYSFLRYVIFFVQYWLVLEAFNIHFIAIISLWLIPVCFLIASAIPTLLISELGVRSSVAVLVFSSLTDNNLSIISASVILWVINIGFPAILGLFGLKELRIKN
jgi:uncharacterized membrane protein YbhN (UPF0104 family)